MVFYLYQRLVQALRLRTRSELFLMSWKQKNATKLGFLNWLVYSIRDT